MGDSTMYGRCMDRSSARWAWRLLLCDLVDAGNERGGGATPYASSRANRRRPEGRQSGSDSATFANSWRCLGTSASCARRHHRPPRWRSIVFEERRKSVAGRRTGFRGRDLRPPSAARTRRGADARKCVPARAGRATVGSWTVTSRNAWRAASKRKRRRRRITPYRSSSPTRRASESLGGIFVVYRVVTHDSE